MTTFNLNEIRAQAEKNFVATWTSTARLLPRGTELHLKGRGKPHFLHNMIQKSRDILLELGFDEVENLTILPASDVIKQYGPEAHVILDRVFYLAELPRPEIGLNDKKIAQTKEISEQIDIKQLRSILRQYKRGVIEADDLITELVTQLSITDSQAIDLLDKVFPEVKELQPIPSNRTLRSHMTATWFYTLSALQEKASLPVALFSVGPRYRNEQREDAHHLRVHYSASVVIMHPEMSLEAGREITRRIMGEYGFLETRFETKTATSKYYAPEQEQEVFINYKGNWLEVADIGMYSPIALANFDIKYPVFNAGFGIERLAMIVYEADDIRRLVFPQFSVVEFTDEEIAKSVTYIATPETPKGKRMAKAIEETAKKYKDEVGPCEFLAWEDDSTRVTIAEKEEGKRLIGPAGFNEICVADGKIYSDIAPSGMYTGINYMRAIAMGAAALIESSKDNLTYQVKTAKHLSDINLQIPESIRKYIEGKQEKIKVGGAIFVAIESQPSKPEEEIRQR